MFNWSSRTRVEGSYNNESEIIAMEIVLYILHISNFNRSFQNASI